MSCFVLFLFGCDKNHDNYTLDNYYQSIVTVKADSSSYWLKLADGTLYWPMNQGYIPFYGIDSGFRGLATYNIIGGKEGRFEKVIRLVSISSILTKNIFTLTDLNKDTSVLENRNPGIIKEGWVENGYLNLLVEFKWHKKVHIINLIQNDTLPMVTSNPTVEGVWALEFWQNSDGDLLTHGSTVRSFVSFIIPKTISIDNLSRINIQYLNWKGKPEIYTITDIESDPILSDSRISSISESVDSDIYCH